LYDFLISLIKNHNNPSIIQISGQFYLGGAGGAGAPGGAGGFLTDAPQPVPIVVHIAARSIILNNLFFIAVSVYRYNMR
jgi:hypothetical protein